MVMGSPMRELALPSDFDRTLQICSPANVATYVRIDAELRVLEGQGCDRCPNASAHGLDDRPLFAFAGFWTEFRGDRGTKSKPIPGPHLVYGFLTTAPNAVVEPIHPKAMP
jgi:hypothetical protein